MLALFRRNLNSWVARLFFALLIGTFVLWGVGDVIRNVAGDDSAVANVGGQKIELPEVQDAYRRQLAQMTRMFGGKIDPTPQMRSGIAAQAVEQLVTQAALNVAVSNMGLGVSDGALRQTVFDVPNFRGQDGKFDRAQFDTVLRNNGITEARFMGLVREDLMQRQLMQSVRAGIAAPDTLVRQVFAIQQERRVADIVKLPFSAAKPPEEPTELALSRWYENHKAQYSTPEYRRIKAVILSPETVTRDLPVTDDEMKAAYAQRRADYSKPEKRSLQVFLLSDEAKAKAVAEKWSAGADVAALNAEAGAPAVELKDATKAEIPAPELAEAAFAAAQGSVPPPVHSALGWHVLKVTSITPGVERPMEAVRDELRAHVLADKAADLIYERAGKIEDLLTGGTALDDMPGDFGLAAVTGTLDAQGNTPEGTPAPIPGGPALHTALIQAAFQMKKGDPARLTEVPREGDAAQAYFAVAVEEVTPPAARPMTEVADAVRSDWTQDAVRHEQETAAARILAEVKAGKPLTDAAAGLQMRQLPPVLRATGSPEVPAQLVDPLFGLAVGEPTMVETPDGFIVAVLAKVEESSPDADPIGYGQVRDALTKAIGDDVQSTLTLALRSRAKPKINAAALASVSQVPE